jgi:hypothetical protein
MQANISFSTDVINAALRSGDLLSYVILPCSYVIKRLIERIKDRGMPVLPLGDLHELTKSAIQTQAE